MKINELASRAFHYIEDRDKLGLFRFLDQNANIAIVDYIDTRGYTLLHMACFKNFSDIGIAIMLRARESITGEQLRIWINEKTKEDGFSALHFASFRGNIDLIECLMHNGADMEQKNIFGINVMHIGA
jgi:ankyrin repeat protein